MRLRDPNQLIQADNTEPEDMAQREAGHADRFDLQPLRRPTELLAPFQPALARTPMTLEQHELLASTFPMPKVEPFVTRHMYKDFAVRAQAPRTRRRVRKKPVFKWLTPPPPIVPYDPEGGQW